MAIILGRDILVKLNGTAVAAAKSCELDISCDLIEVSSPFDGIFKKYITERKSWSVSVGKFVTSVTDGAAMVGQTVTLSFGVGNDVLTGSAIVDKWQCTGDVGSLAKGSLHFRGSGVLG